MGRENGEDAPAASLPDLPLLGCLGAEDHRPRTIRLVTSPARKALDAKMSERELQDAIVQMARLKEWLIYHPHDSRHSAPGYPDLTMVHPDKGCIVFAELKRDGRCPTMDQYHWLDALADPLREDVGVYLWTPRDWSSGAIEHVLDEGPQTVHAWRWRHGPR